MSVFQTPPAGLGEKASVAAARILREAILSGELAPGQVLGEEILGKQLGISRTPVREALVLLQLDGLVELPANRRAVVRTFTADDLHEMHSLRAVLEGHAARSAAGRLSARDLSALERSCERYASLAPRDDELPQLVEENLAFHDTIVRAAGSERLAQMIRSTTALPIIYRSYMTYSRENRERALVDHRGILEALRDEDGALAEQRMKDHVLLARDIALDHLALMESEEAPA
jgi:DNA-binding GntR family transcriptional regulator